MRSIMNSLIPFLPDFFSFRGRHNGKYYAVAAHRTKKGPGRKGMGPKVNPAGTKLARKAANGTLTKMN